MKTPLYAVALAALLAGQTYAGDQPRSDAPRGDSMRADQDGDGRVSRAEAEAAGDQRTNEWFDKLDLDKDGYVTQDETRQARETRHDQMRQKFEASFKAADINSDGQLSLDEAQAKMPKLAERFDKLDKDKNGLLSQEELKRGPHHRMPEPKP
jgi:Ca2+-binding EF-hand superfamily protein